MPDNALTKRKVHETDPAALDDAEDGRLARSPSDMPRRAWKAILLRTWQSISDDRLSLLAAGVAFYMLFAIFPGLTAIISLFGLLADPTAVQQQLEPMKEVLPEQAWSVIRNQLSSLASAGTSGLSITGLISLLFALVSARLAAYSMMDALNAVYNEVETRSFFKVNVIAMLFTLAAISALIFFVVLVVFAPIALNTFGLGDEAEMLIRYVRWPLLAFAMALGLALTYRYAPNRRPPKWRWVTWGSILATLLWLVGSVGFSWYVEAFNTYDRVYGSIGAVIILLFWLWLTAFVSLLGAALDMQIEHQTSVDSTVGEEKPMGQRGAYVADTIAKIP